jgi:hypothetical protein
MYSDMHDKVAQSLEDENLHFTFHNSDDEVNSIRSYDTNITGRFNCHNQNCKSNGWHSNRIAITIRMYRNEQYNARVYFQRCKACNRISKPTLDDTYAERVAYRIKKWCGVELEAPAFSGESRGPHESSLCEGCRAGHCSEARRMNELVSRFSNFAL